jgi:hypothetical protein
MSQNIIFKRMPNSPSYHTTVLFFHIRLAQVFLDITATIHDADYRDGFSRCNR